ncbi:phage holin family protein [Aquisalibacillus elongatus]|uniref:Holin family Hol44 protein (Superfamily V) n=1 Tax=Aquisalibacillus elongatus TaxID=485577 RepID=A0A3N5C2A4_9BACI|nr:phage holin family protein [Aquisalibacillus elongatus]RPF52145.1 holin family Hol44 protein (superfamily V) [Aquisalibacillus elongatus]
MEFMNFIMEEALILVPVLMILGKMIKQAKLFPTRFIPLTLLGISLILTSTMLGFNFNSIIQAILIAGAAVFGHQLFKQMREQP